MKFLSGAPLTFGAVILVTFFCGLVIFSLVSGAGTTIESVNGEIFVKRGGDFQAALNQARPGDTIKLEAGATYPGPFTLPRKNGDSFITITTSAQAADLPAAGERVNPKRHSQSMPKLISETVEPVVLATDGAHHYRFVAVEFGGTKDGVGNIVQIGSSAEKTMEELPHHIEFDRVYMRATSPLGQRRGIAANGKHVKVLNSHIEGIRRKGDESQAIAAWSTDGPIEIINNYLEAAAINILFGGGAPVMPLVPTDCIVKDNHLNKPVEWKGTDWVVKNLFEIKNGKRIRIENNLMTHNWGMGQDGMAVLFTTRMDSGEATVIEDITFTHNIVRGSGGALSVMGEEGAGGRRLTIRNNIFEDIDGAKWNSAGRFMKATDWDGLIIESNTILQTGNISVAYGDPVKGFVFRNNIVFENEYGFAGDGLRPGRDVIVKAFSNGVVQGNIVIGGHERNYDRSNILLPSIESLKFRDAATGDYRLAADSPYRRRGVGGMHIGADLDPRTVGRSVVP